MLDQQKLGEVVARQMEAISADYGDDAEIGDVVVICEVLSPERGSDVRVRTSALRTHHAIGLVEVAKRTLLAMIGHGID